MIEERDDQQESPATEEPRQDEGPDVSELDQDPAYNPDEAGLKGLKDLKGG
jgi:hypothetical protein